MLCKNCGRELPIAGKFCPFCGAVVEQELSLIHISEPTRP